jgi:hypothetical protein
VIPHCGQRNDTDPWDAVVPHDAHDEASKRKVFTGEGREAAEAKIESEV